ncbi:MAG: molybdopterin-dependent oxidoreductase [Anaerolineaceae bacterium]|nr:molybdopterin-dependent oxidoreductase [Anaerolineaceae bacterium]
MNLDRRAMEKEMQQAGRLPPGQALTVKFPVLHYGAVPAFDESTWRLRIWGAVDHEVQLTWQAFNALPKVRLTMDLHCVTKWSKFDTTWEGVYLATLLQEIGMTVLPQANYVIQHAPEGYTTNLPVRIALAENFLLATGFEGQPLSPEHGYPLRGVLGAIPGRKDLKDIYLWKGAKWLNGLEFSTQDQPGFWEQAGYHNEGEVWLEQRAA